MEIQIVTTEMYRKVHNLQSQLNHTVPKKAKSSVMICSHDLTKSQNPLLCEQGNIVYTKENRNRIRRAYTHTISFERLHHLIYSGL